MNLEVLRYSSGTEATLGLLFGDNDEFLCYTLEDEARPVKVTGETRIPAGEYEIKLRTVGGKHAKYATKYPDIHKGMLWLQDVPGFEYILIHAGNTDGDTEGCLLLGDNATQNVTGEGSIGASVNAYRRVYPQIAAHILAGEKVTIRYIDHG
jgi:hypothetical protein